ncbi:hypothetical protein EJ06DRAFT_548636 [Trichodelitschia bisporula]|uniref:THIF-type NAD/FAD binding fold domain-containing protein n=1 Tax=Trichodelitschia bisporula TaxID=703511 RepID=A0A6G1HXK5_9PEZI|nr:hypothetical protein EJ06DRAFT_548636 [Trichodelitschia bisporula]
MPWPSIPSPTSLTQRTQLALTAVASSTLALGLLLSYQRLSREQRLREIKSAIPPIDGNATHLTPYGAAALSKEDARGAALAARARHGDYDQELINEQLARTSVFLTPAGLAAVRESFVVVVGCGGVGSHAAAALVRSGIGSIRLVDFDQVTLSSLNRHAVATLADVGTPKVHALRRRLEHVAPWVKFDCRAELFSAGSAGALLGEWEGRKPDWVVDAIDNVDSKVALLHYCATNGIKVVSAMGAGCKSDPTRVFVGDISSTTDDPLSRHTRRRLRALGITSGIPTIFSTEKPGTGKAQLLPLPEAQFQEGSIDELSVLKDFRIRILPVLGTLPAVFGLAAANHVLLALADYPREYFAAKARPKTYDAALNALQGSEERLARAAGEADEGVRVPLDVDDAGYLIEEVWRGRSCGVRHEREVLKGGKGVEEVYSAGVVNLVKERMAEEAEYAKWR